MDYQNTMSRNCRKINNIKNISSFYYDTNFYCTIVADVCLRAISPVFACLFMKFITNYMVVLCIVIFLCICTALHASVYHVYLHNRVRSVFLTAFENHNICLDDRVQPASSRRVGLRYISCRLDKGSWFIL